MSLDTPPLSALLLSAVFALSACSKPAPQAEPLRAVKVLAVGQGGQQGQAEFSGEVRARVESRLGFRVAGKVIRRAAEPGQRVKAGEVLAQLDPQDYQLAVDAARAQLAAAASNRDLAAADFKRYQSLREQNFISAAELQRRETTLQAAQAQFNQAQAQLAGQGNQARYTTLVADGAGIVTAVDAEVGQVVAAGTPVVRLAQDGARDVVFAVPENTVQSVRPGAVAEVTPWGAAAALQGRVREVAASADPVTRTYSVKVALDAKEALPLGSTATVRLGGIAANSQPTIKLPTSALLKEGDKTTVWVLDAKAMTVQQQVVQLAGADGNDVLVTQGLQLGMQVVVAGVHVLSPGQKVMLYQPRQTAPATPAAAAPAQ